MSKRPVNRNADTVRINEQRNATKRPQNKDRERLKVNARKEEPERA